MEGKPASLYTRLGGYDAIAAVHWRVTFVIQRAIEIAAAYFQGERP